MNPLISTSYHASATAHAYSHASFASGTVFVFARRASRSQGHLGRRARPQILRRQRLCAHLGRPTLRRQHRLASAPPQEAASLRRTLAHSTQLGLLQPGTQLDRGPLLSARLPCHAQPCRSTRAIQAGHRRRTRKAAKTAIKIRIAALRSDISQLSELLRRDFCTELLPDKILEHPAVFFRRRYRVIRAIQKLYTEHSACSRPTTTSSSSRVQGVRALRPAGHPFLARSTRSILRIFHGEDISPSE